MEQAMTSAVERTQRGPVVHELKCWESYFHGLQDGSKMFELRKFDRDFRIGDTLHIRETTYADGMYTGRECWRNISYILAHEDDLGLKDGFAILSLCYMSDPVSFVQN